jgi:hypothetical protein
MNTTDEPSEKKVFGLSHQSSRGSRRVIVSQRAALSLDRREQFVEPALVAHLSGTPETLDLDCPIVHELDLPRSPGVATITLIESR